MKLALLLLCASCAPLRVSSYVSAREPIGLGHDFDGVVGLELGMGRVALRAGVEHPGDGDERMIYEILITLWVF